jgi:hypothetical protein
MSTAALPIPALPPPPPLPAPPTSLPVARHRRAPFPAPGCPYCGAELPLGEMTAGPQLCLSCAGDFEGTPFSPPSLYLPPRALVEAGPEGGTSCAVHAGNLAVGNCARCGLFLCALCRVDVPGGEAPGGAGGALCAACFDRLARDKTVPALRTSFLDLRGLALFTGLVGFLFFYFGIVLGPLTLVLAGLAARQKRRGQGSGGWLGIAVAFGLGIAQLGIGVFLLVQGVRK